MYEWQEATCPQVAPDADLGVFEPAGLLGQAPRQAQLEARALRRVRQIHSVDPGVPPILPDLAEHPLKLEARDAIRPSRASTCFSRTEPQVEVGYNLGELLGLPAGIL
jgi:hypothetical protein